MGEPAVITFPTRIVGIGASAGGLESLEQLFAGIPADTGMAFVVLQHLSRGILEVKRAGGLVLAESTTSAKFDGMPLSAQATGVVDHVHMPRDIARVLCGLPPLQGEEAEALSDDPAMAALFGLLRDQFKIDFSLYKISTVSRRIQRRLDLLRIESVDAYVEQLRTDADELNGL